MAEKENGKSMFLRNNGALVLFVIAIVWSDFAVADHVPDNLSQDVDPNYIGCMMAVEDAQEEFRDVLQANCMGRMADICIGQDGATPTSQVVDCIYFEIQRGIGFLQAAVTDLPQAVENDGFFSRSYERRLDDIKRDVDAAKNFPKPQSIDTAIQQSFTMAIATTTLFYLARKTGTKLDSHLVATFGDH